MQDKDKKTQISLENLRQIRIEKKKRIEQYGANPFDNKFVPSHTADQIKKIYSSAATSTLSHEDGTIDDNIYSIAGRVMTIRFFGKAAFFHLLDATGLLQVYVRKDVVDNLSWQLFGETDTGDFVGVVGKVFRTKTGELTLLAQKIHFITKSIRPLPEKWHGLTDTELRYRQRYLDLISNSYVKELFMVRSLIIQSLRDYLIRSGFIEVETPMLHMIKGGAAAKPFVTYHNALGMNFYLRIAPELYLKRLLVGGMGKVFEIGKCFRNEGISTKHNPEFTILEFYEEYADYLKVLERAEEMIKEVEARVHEKFPAFREKRPYDIQKPWERMTMVNAICKFGREAGITEKVIESEDLCRQWYEKTFSRQDSKKDISHGEIIYAMFETLVEPMLGKGPVVIFDFPADVSPLARRKDGNKFWVDRFEVYLDGREIINAFSELNDPTLQAEAFAMQVQAGVQGNEEAMEYDHDYIIALEHGMPPAGGFGLGIDRLFMSLCQLDSIREAILFPALKPQQDEKKL